MIKAYRWLHWNWHLLKQLKELLDEGYIQSSKAPYDALVLLQRKQDGSLLMFVRLSGNEQGHYQEKLPGAPCRGPLFDRLSKDIVLHKVGPALSILTSAHCCWGWRRRLV